jgi:hypothetical protein
MASGGAARAPSTPHSRSAPFLSQRRLILGHQPLVVAELVAAVGPVPVGRRLDADPDQRATRRLDLLRHRQEVTVRTDDHDRRDVRKADHVLGRIQAQLDVRPVLGHGPGREQLDQLDRVVQQGFAVPRKPLPVAVRAVDRHGAERRTELHQRRHVDTGSWGENRVCRYVPDPFSWSISVA